MKKILIAGLVVLTTAGTAFAQHRGHGGGHYVGHYHGHRGGNNILPWIAGAAALGVIGAIWYDQYGRRCWREVVAYDDWGNPIVRRFCN